MFKYLLIMNLLIMMVITQDMPPPDLDISTRVPLTTTETITVEPIAPEPTTTETITTTTEAETTTIIDEPTTTTQSPITSTEAPTTIRNDVAIPSATDSPFLPITTTTLASTYPYYPNQSDYPGVRCYLKRQYGYPKWRWTCQGFRYVENIECFKCCLFPYSNFAGCFKIHSHQCNFMNHHRGYYK